MKKLLLAFLLVVSLVACGNGNGSNNGSGSGDPKPVVKTLICEDHEQKVTMVTGEDTDEIAFMEIQFRAPADGYGITEENFEEQREVVEGEMNGLFDGVTYKAELIDGYLVQTTSLAYSTLSEDALSYFNLTDWSKDINALNEEFSGESGVTCKFQ